uniref:protein-tyrosine-phosphatase n=1 Tax=Poecilia latipinna TaxID=48699 RepID=A0A3B3U521_9TELE
MFLPPLCFSAPGNVIKVEVVTQNTSSLTLKWDKVDGISTYRLEYEENGAPVSENINDAAGETFVQHVVSGLTDGTEYSFSLFTELNGVSSSGFSFSAATVPGNVGNVSVVTQNTSSITLRWDKVNSNSTYRLEYEVNGAPVSENINAAAGETFVQHVVSGLTNGTEYSFTLFTEANGLSSSGFIFSAATVVTQNDTSITLKWNKVDGISTYRLEYEENGAPVSENINDAAGETFVQHVVSGLTDGTEYTPENVNNVSVVTQNDTSITLKWNKVDGISTYRLEYEENGAPVSENINDAAGETFVQHVVSGLTDGTEYSFSLFTEANRVSSSGFSFAAATVPPSIFAHCSYWGSGYSALIKWDQPVGVWTTGELTINGKTVTLNPDENQLIVDGLQPAKTYKVSVNSKLETEADPLKSELFTFFCSTDNRGVIGGSVFGVLLIVVLICVIVFLFLSFCEAEVDHFTLVSFRGVSFSASSQSLSPAGTNQTQKAATLPENRGKNRFTNILPYDWSRVKLNTPTPNNILDYINANYLPGYSSSKEYIACQGPLPNTVSDFWRMVWEQKVKRIVMVTNCVEAGRTKCEQYWPEDRSPCAHGNLIVSKMSEERESNWVLREFKVKHAKERTVKHFHFTAWPDHGVPQGTEVLIRFRGLVRKHIESEGSKAPTVVHCSAGVGRTGTIIALDVLLQQLQQERAVGINSFVYKMRQHRSHMVQTESQYVFLHQCIMDSLQPPGVQEENVYENGDLMYVNATALRQLR